MAPCRTTEKGPLGEARAPRHDVRDPTGPPVRVVSEPLTPLSNFRGEEVEAGLTGHLDKKHDLWRLSHRDSDFGMPREHLFQFRKWFAK